MSFTRRYRFELVFAAFLVFCSVMVVRQFNTNQSKHLELREAFILLNSRGYRPQAERLYQNLLNEIDRLPDRTLFEDFQRTLTLVDPSRDETDNLVWQYHWTVSNELEKRSAASLQRALNHKCFAGIHAAPVPGRTASFFGWGPTNSTLKG